jgi:hypothetical protein
VAAHDLLHHAQLIVVGDRVVQNFNYCR